MKQVTLTTEEFIIRILAIIGLAWLAVQLIKSLIPQPAPVVHVTVNMPEPKAATLTASGHVKGLIKIGCDKIIENVVFLPLSLIFK